MEKINQENLRKQEEKLQKLQSLLNTISKNLEELQSILKNYLREYAELTNQQLKKELEKLKDGIDRMYKLLTEEITDEDL